MGLLLVEGRTEGGCIYVATLEQVAPQTGGESFGYYRGNGLTGLALPTADKTVDSFLFADTSQPVDEQYVAVSVFRQMAGCIGGKAEDGWSAEAFMGNEDTAFTTERCASQ